LALEQDPAIVWRGRRLDGEGDARGDVGQLIQRTFDLVCGGRQVNPCTTRGNDEKDAPQDAARCFDQARHAFELVDVASVYRRVDLRSDPSLAGLLQDLQRALKAPGYASKGVVAPGIGSSDADRGAGGTRPGKLKGAAM